MFGPLVTLLGPSFAKIILKTSFKHLLWNSVNCVDTRDVEAEAGNWKRKRWKWLNFCGSGSTLKKEAGSRSELGSI